MTTAEDPKCIRCKLTIKPHEKRERQYGKLWHYDCLHGPPEWINGQVV